MAGDNCENKPYILGIDPGLRGALAILDEKHRVIKAIEDMPLKTVGHKSRVDLFLLSTFIGAYAPDIRLAITEDLFGMPGQSTQSTFQLGRSLGELEGIITAYFIPITRVRPAIWKSFFGLSADKQLSLDKAKNLFPDSQSHFARKKDDGRAEAVLLAAYGSLVLRGSYGALSFPNRGRRVA